MRMSRGALVVALLLVFAGQPGAEEVAGLPLHVDKLSERAVRLWVGDHVSATAVTALATRDGVVVIDTTDLAGVDAQYRKIIARELGRDDFVYLVNTHEHWDHTLGNAAYADCEIIAHELTPVGMKARTADIQRAMGWISERLPELEAEQAEANDPEAAAAVAERVAVARLRRQAFAAFTEPTLPTITFSDRLTLDMGDVTLELFYAGGVHTASDIFVLVPEEGLLFTGDTMADEWLAENPGCLAAFMIRNDVEHDFPLLLSNWEAVLARRNEVRDLVPGHWNGDISWKGFEQRYQYVNTLWNGINQAVADGTRLVDLFSLFALEERFPELVGSPGITDRNHAASILGVWTEITGAESAAGALRSRVPTEDVERVVAELRAARAAGTERYFFLEGDLNRLGYDYLGEDKVDEAVAVFELNAEVFPGSWNVWDSLAEACLARGDRDRAIELYRKSLELNPESESGRGALQRLGVE